jgi:glycosyltransferase involved in cell wall biosynthesis
MYDVSVIILCYNRLPYTKKCYESLLKNCPENTEVVFVDNGSVDGTRDWLTSIKKDNVKVVLNDKNLFPAGGNATGLRNASEAKAYLLCDNDGFFEDDLWYKTAMMFFEDFPDVGIVGMRKSRWQHGAPEPLQYHKEIEYKETQRVASFSLLRPKVAKYLGTHLHGKWIGHVIAILAKRINYKSIRIEKGYILDQSDEDLNNPEYRKQYERLWAEKRRLNEFYRRIGILDKESGR